MIGKMIYKDSIKNDGKVMTVRVYKDSVRLYITKEIKETEIITIIEPAEDNISLAQYKAEEIMKDFINSKI